MKGSYISALEKQAQWFAWGSEWLAGKAMEPWERRRMDQDYYASMAAYVTALANADTIYMNAKFCELVDHARLSVPDELEFEEQWMLCENGFVVLETPFEIPKMTFLFPGVAKLTIAAVAWMKTDQGYYFMCFQDFGIFDLGKTGFAAWTHFHFKSGEKLIDRIREFEAKARVDETCGSYELGRDSEMRHEMRWIFTALHLMSQKMTHISEHQTSWMARDMARRKKLKIAPKLKVVSLRRMEEARKSAGAEGTHVDWQWQWVVQGHWRLQPYRTLKDYKWIFIEAYIKGPDDKPIKPDVPTIYKAVR